LTQLNTTLIIIEKQINDIIVPSVSLKGDIRIKGDTYFFNEDTQTDFVSIDTSENFVGIGTNDRTANYSSNFATTSTGGDISRQNCVVSNYTYPVFIGERIAEVQPLRDISGVVIQDETITNNSVLFTNCTSLTARRKSNYYTIDELKELSTLYTPDAIAGPNIGSQLTYRYGADINFEIMDKSMVTRELGNIHMVIDDISNNNIKAGFGVSVIDVNNETNEPLEREVMYVNNDGVLHVDKIALGPDKDILSIRNESGVRILYINDTPIAQISF
jgi:hypothetical protein